MKQATIVFCLRGSEVLLGMKKKGFGEGKWNGFGGKVAERESIEAAAVRELKEEAGIEVATSNLSKAAVLEFYFAETPIFECHVFLACEFSGELLESEEMHPQWFTRTDIPYSEMWPDDVYWLPAVLSGRMLEAKCIFDAGGAVVERMDIRRASF